jgi:hypothetical protein
MFSTVETRWFGEGPLPRHVRDWFRSEGRCPEPQPIRTDYYLRLPGNQSLGIKMREGRIELKQCLQVFGATDFRASITGVIEGWNKWSFGLGEADANVTRLQGAHESWLGVVKERWLCTYTLNGDNEIVDVPADPQPLSGCNLELSRVKVESPVEAWWTVGLEAFGRDANLYDLLIKMGGHVFASNAALRLRLRDSYSYPQWLSGVWGRN